MLKKEKVTLNSPPSNVMDTKIKDTFVPGFDHKICLSLHCTSCWLSAFGCHRSRPWRHEDRRRCTRCEEQTPSCVGGWLWICLSSDHGEDWYSSHTFPRYLLWLGDWLTFLTSVSPCVCLRVFFIYIYACMLIHLCLDDYADWCQHSIKYYKKRKTSMATDRLHQSLNDPTHCLWTSKKKKNGERRGGNETIYSVKKLLSSLLLLPVGATSAGAKKVSVRSSL